MSIAGLFAADSAIADAARRGLMAASVPRLAGRGDRSSRAIARALRTTALGRMPREERDWIARIDARRQRVDELALEIDPICAFFSVPGIWGRLQLRLVRELAPRRALELGTAFGISAAFQAAALELNGGGRLVTLDREPRLAELAQQTFDELGLAGRVEQRVGAIAETLPDLAREITPIDYAFLDAEHTEQATIAAFETILPELADGAVVVVDDIRLNADMGRAWAAIRANPRVGVGLDLRRFGIVVAAGGPAP